MVNGLDGKREEISRLEDSDSHTPRVDFGWFRGWLPGGYEREKVIEKGWQDRKVHPNPFNSPLRLGQTHGEYIGTIDDALEVIQEEARIQRENIVNRNHVIRDLHRSGKGLAVINAAAVETEQLDCMTVGVYFYLRGKGYNRYDLTGYFEDNSGKNL